MPQRIPDHFKITFNLTYGAQALKALRFSSKLWGAEFLRAVLLDN